MTIFFRTTRFDTSSEQTDDSFYGEDLAQWLAGALSGWETSVDAEDWGWAVGASRDSHLYLIGVYDHDVTDVSDQGPRWCLRLNNQRDRSVPWYKKLFRHVEPMAHPEVVAEIEALLRQQPDFHDIQVTSPA